MKRPSNPSLRPAFEQSKEEGTTIKLVNCVVKHGKNDLLEIFANNHSKTMQSPKKFQKGEASLTNTNDIQLSQLSALAVGQKVNVRAKVIALATPEIIDKKDGKQLTLQNISIADAGRCVKLSLWEESIGTLKQDRTYYIKDVRVREYNHRKMLSATPDWTFHEISDLGDVIEELSDTEDEITTNDILTGEIDVVITLEDYPCCKTCKSKVKHIIIDTLISQCTKCDAMMKTKKCETATTAKVILDCDENRTVTMFTNVITKLITGINGHSTATKLLNVPPHNFTVAANNIVYNVTKL